MLKRINLIFSLIGERYLDTQFSKSQIDVIEKRLKENYIYWPIRWPLEVIAAIGLCWNLIWWEWTYLDFRDVVIGWFSTLSIISPICLVIWLIFSFRIATILFFFLLIPPFLVGMAMRKGSKEN